MVKKVIVVGAGAWGGWSACMLQSAGYQVTLVDKAGPGNTKSGSGGKTRVIRMAYGGSEVYTEMVSRSFQLWEGFSEKWQAGFFHPQSSLWMFRGIEPAYARLSQPLMRARGYELEAISLETVAERYPQINLRDITSAYFEPKAGYLEAHRACTVVRDEFVKTGGTYLNEEIVSIEGQDSISALRTRQGERLVADHYVFACGPWMRQLFPTLEPLITVSRQEVYYYEAPEGHSSGELPIWLEMRAGDRMFYGIPDHFGEGFKLAYDQRNWSLDPDGDDRGVTPAILKEMNAVVANRFPALAGAGLVKHHTCVYESTADGHYIMDQAPGFSNALMLCGSSGHGFKMGPAVGEMVRDYIHAGKALPREFRAERLRQGNAVKGPYEL
jgi:glycine/D-amino acid oxidase-like deaminating enzyme